MDKAKKSAWREDIVKYVASLRDTTREGLSRETAALGARQRELKQRLRSAATTDERAAIQREHCATRFKLRGVHAWIEMKKSSKLISCEQGGGVVRHRPGFGFGVTHRIGYTTSQVYQSAVRAARIVRDVCLESEGRHLWDKGGTGQLECDGCADDLAVLLSTGPRAETVTLEYGSECSCGMVAVNAGDVRVFAAGTGVYDARSCGVGKRLNALEAWKQIHMKDVRSKKTLRRRIVTERV